MTKRRKLDEKDARAATRPQALLSPEALTPLLCRENSPDVSKDLNGKQDGQRRSKDICGRSPEIVSGAPADESANAGPDVANTGRLAKKQKFLKLNVGLLAAVGNDVDADLPGAAQRMRLRQPWSLVQPESALLVSAVRRTGQKRSSTLLAYASWIPLSIRRLVDLGAHWSLHWRSINTLACRPARECGRERFRPRWHTFIVFQSSKPDLLRMVFSLVFSSSGRVGYEFLTLRAAIVHNLVGGGLS
ncbi:MAG: hypothetical protein ACP5QZ_05045 [Candidatus Sumerlaeaceae bacterium]